MSDLFNYFASADTALRLISKFGKAYTVTHNAPTVATPEALKPSAMVTTTGTLKAVVLPVKAGQGAFAEGKGDDRITQAMLTGRYRNIIAAAKGATLVPVAGDFISIQNRPFEIVTITTLQPADVPLIYTIGAVQST